MRIGELAGAAKVSPRVLRHYESRGLLSPGRTTAGYRDYAEEDIVTVRRIRIMISAGLSTAVIRRYLDCVHAPEDDIVVDMCPALRAELDAVAERIDAERRRLATVQQSLDELRR